MFYGEFEYEVGFLINLKKWSEKIEKIYKITLIRNIDEGTPRGYENHVWRAEKVHIHRFQPRIDGLRIFVCLIYLESLRILKDP